MGFTWQSMLRVAGVRMVPIKLWGNHESLYCKSSTLQPSKVQVAAVSRWKFAMPACESGGCLEVMEQLENVDATHAWSMSFKDPR